MRIEELELICREAASNLADRGQRPVPTSVVLPLPAATQVVTLEDFPDDDPSRFDLLSAFASERMRPLNAPCYGFVAEALLADGGLDVLVVVYGARGHHPHVVAAPLEAGGLGEFTDAEELEPTALPFLAPLQHAADAATPPDALG